MSTAIKEPLKLPCGLVFPNRLVKAAMAEGLAEGSHLPGPRISRVYGEWANGGWGALLTGNVQVDVRHLGGNGDLAASESHENDHHSMDTWRRYAESCQKHGTPAIAQICHPGRQSPRGAGERGFFERTIAPSEVPLDVGSGWVANAIRDLIFGVPKAMSRSDIDRVIAQFVTCARILARCGFSGIEIHAAHGYLLSQFLSPRSNIRQDEYGGSAERRARIVLEIIQQIRDTVPATFCIGIKLNSADLNTSECEDTMTQIRLFADAGIDFLEISGGSYEDPTMMGRGVRDETSPGKSQSTESREAFFLDFARQTRKQFPDLILLLTGGFRTRKGIEGALNSGACDLVGIGRPAVLKPDFPRLMMDDMYTDQEARVVFSKVQVPFLASLLKMRMLGGGAETRYFRDQIQRIATGLLPYAP
ncbi:NADH:flavin oxidoreductase/NADH oxidase family protein [Aspergillus niger CBS 101883]|uniref:NADH:flavin oxidoreductase/NADH oxidase family protein n=1 Tax=Aspergillus lacticoffeatus (strain CBS 101883) TaxID=1450533 RepID=UPI000D8059BE|nr:FMN binding oxidoreductase [Aspergillus niger CBS 101883]PYH56066.1 FMN binding oxidoreductase [Aspergillus niger CBS 101883]